MVSEFVHSFVTFLVILDPIGTAAIFAVLTRGVALAQRREIAWRGILIAGAILFAFAFAGEPLLQALGISLPALRIAGGALLFLLAIDMVFARPSGIRSPTRPEQREAEQRDDVAVFPLAFPLIAGPGALTSVALLMGRSISPAITAGILATLLVVLGLTLLALLHAGAVVRFLGITGANVVGRLLGVILAAFAAQFLLDGVASLMARG